jgi:hypothetical protein
VDGTFNTLLALYDPVPQTDIHAAARLDGPSSSAALAAVLRNFELLFTVNAVAYLTGYLMLGAMIVRARAMPRGIGILFIVGGATHRQVVAHSTMGGRRWATWR